MKYHNLYIHFPPSLETYNAVTEILQRTPNKYEISWFDDYDEPSTWWFQLIENDKEEDYLDFIDVFLDILEPNFLKLEELGIKKEDILIWLVYEYQHQCSLSFNPKEFERLSRCGISLNIDCLERK